MTHPYEPNGVITIADNLRLRAEVDQLRVEIGDLKQRLGLAEVLRNQLRKQRDEARREWCRLWAHTDGRNLASTQAARLRKWDCFKKENHNA